MTASASTAVSDAIPSIEALEARLAVEQDPDRRYELQLAIDAQRMQASSGQRPKVAEVKILHSDGLNLEMSLTATIQSGEGVARLEVGAPEMRSQSNSVWVGQAKAGDQLKVISTLRLPGVGDYIIPAAVSFKSNGTLSADLKQLKVRVSRVEQGYAITEVAE